MAWTYEQLTGKFTNADNTAHGTGYSGHPPHVNKSEDEGLLGLGPIPKGTYLATHVELHTEKHGPFVIVLKPDVITRAKILAYGRDPDSFRIHGERISPPAGMASEGCIIQPRIVRDLFWEGTDHEVTVV